MAAKIYMCPTEDFGVNDPTTSSPHALKGQNATIGAVPPKVDE